jgi:hypothetical protein
MPDATGPLIVHRLDIETSGLLVVGLNRPAHRRLSKQFMDRKVGRPAPACRLAEPAAADRLSRRGETFPHAVPGHRARRVDDPGVVPPDHRSHTSTPRARRDAARAGGIGMPDPRGHAVR